MISHIDSAKLKLARASEHIKEIKERAASYAASEPHEIIVEAEYKATMRITYPPHDVAIPIGEALYQMRSALDHLVFGLIRTTNPAPPIDWDKTCEFPLKLNLPDGVPATPVPFGHKSFSRALPGVGLVPFTVIERLQPYYPHDAPNTWLRFLAKLSNIDKHRRLNLLRPRIRQTEIRPYSASLRTLDDRAEVHSLDEANESVDVERRFEAVITFNEHDSLAEADGIPVDHILEECSNIIETVVVPMFEKFA
jgi:hypothetical protein